MRDFRVGSMREFARPELAQAYGNRLEIAAETFDLVICQPRRLDDIDGAVLKMRPESVEVGRLPRRGGSCPLGIIPKDMPRKSEFGISAAKMSAMISNYQNACRTSCFSSSVSLK